VVYKGGRGEEMSRTTFAHTGALAGDYAFYEKAFSQAGMIAVDSITEVVDTAKALAFQPPAGGNRVAILSVQAGPAIIIADQCRRQGLALAGFSAATKKKLKKLASPLNAVDNPVDLAWKSDEFDACRQMLKAVLDDDGVDAIIVAAVFYASNMELMKAVVDIAGEAKKPITVCLDSPRGAAQAEINALEASGVPVSPLPERAVSGMAGLVKYGKIAK